MKNFSAKSLKENLSAKEEFTQVNPCRESNKKPLGQESFKENLSVKEEFPQVNPCRESNKKPLGQESFKENLSAKEEFTQVNPYWESNKKPKVFCNSDNTRVFFFKFLIASNLLFWVFFTINFKVIVINMYSY